jgi:hypothetical protein
MEAICSSETSVAIQHATRREDRKKDLSENIGEKEEVGSKHEDALQRGGFLV